MNTVTKDVCILHFSEHPKYKDLAKLEASSNECFWDERDFKRMLRNTNYGCYLLAKLKQDWETSTGSMVDRIIGFVLYEKHKNRFEILNLVIAPDYRRKKLGSALLGRMKKKLNKHRTFLSFDLRERNLEAQSWLRKNRFMATGVAKDYFVDQYHDSIEREDAFTFEHRKEFDDSREEMVSDDHHLSPPLKQ